MIYSCWYIGLIVCLKWDWKLWVNILLVEVSCMMIYVKSIEYTNVNVFVWYIFFHDNHVKIHIWYVILKPGLLFILPWSIMNSLTIYRGLYLRLVCMDYFVVNNSNPSSSQHSLSISSWIILFYNTVYISTLNPYIFPI